MIKTSFANPTYSFFSEKLIARFINWFPNEKQPVQMLNEVSVAQLDLPQYNLFNGYKNTFAFLILKSICSLMIRKNILLGLKDVTLEQKNNVPVLKIYNGS